VEGNQGEPGWEAKKEFTTLAHVYNLELTSSFSWRSSF
jgi:hypothetical protein